MTTQAPQAPPTAQTPQTPPAPHPTRYEELARQLTGIGAVKRDLARMLPPDCPPGSAAVLTLLDRHGEMRLGRLADLMAIDISVTSRHVAHVADRGWITRDIDPGDGRCRILRLTPAGHALLAELGARYTGALERALADWSAHDIDVLNALLARLRSSF
ncbi:MarR family winged helix-turn-helix transcriptional regulator [Streptomyces sp. KS 21]|uniref:MarR family winged helix-turn-helix transcriptional regulator n=1 Tax=Streptomyces sp. KS 21 TaxID=2485150 RepID=UPI0010629CBB|nr:MarR family winged helix-turn-helix transcriptional regulator [Streptomyces sp. KS 21]TDU77296.1 MarR family transcriptional regulator [Streptomyces sp. KS 21]